MVFLFYQKYFFTGAFLLVPEYIWLPQILGECDFPYCKNDPTYPSLCFLTYFFSHKLLDSGKVFWQSIVCLSCPYMLPWAHSVAHCQRYKGQANFGADKYALQEKWQFSSSFCIQLPALILSCPGHSHSCSAEFPLPQAPSPSPAAITISSAPSLRAHLLQQWCWSHAYKPNCT